MIRPLLVFLASLATLIPVASANYRLPPEPGERIGRPSLSPGMRRASSLGFEALGSDWYLLEAIQYYGDRTNMREQYVREAWILRRAIDLDPDYGFLYRFAGETVPFHDRPSHLWFNTNAAIDLLQIGMKSRSKRWEIPFMLGYLLFTFRGDYKNAGLAMHEAAERTGGPRYLPSLSARLLAQGGSTALAIDLTKAAIQQAIDEKQAGMLAERLKSLVLQQGLEELNAVAARRKQAGLPVRDLADLRDGLAGKGLPPEPFGGEFIVNPVTGVVKSTDDGQLLHLEVHPGQPAIEPSAS